VSASFHLYGLLVRVLSEVEYGTALEQLADALPSEVAAVDTEGRVLVWNRALVRSPGPRESALGRPLLEAMPALAKDPSFDWSEALHRAIAHAESTELPRHPLGERLVSATVVPLSGPAGGVLGAAIVVDDITERERSEERRRLRARSRAVEDLGAGIAHEVRNPLNAASLHLQLLRERLEDPEASRADLVSKTDAMIAELKRMDELVTHLLEVSRGRPPALERARIDSVVDRVVRRMAETAKKAGVSLRSEPGSKRTLSLDPARLDRALHNLVRNAVEAAPRGGHVTVATRDDPHSTVVVVDDDGPGIPLAERSRLFELFFTTKRGGTGLGLPLAKRAVEDHGGELEVLDRPGGGARFVVHLPLEGALDGPEAAGDSPAGDSPAADEREGPWRGS
jgi:PAS domain S-box-containing protein